jgi:hypothetical protein
LPQATFAQLKQPPISLPVSSLNRIGSLVVAVIGTLVDTASKCFRFVFPDWGETTSYWSSNNHNSINEPKRALIAIDMEVFVVGGCEICTVVIIA